MVGEPADIEIEGFLWEYGPGQNVEHLARHDVSPADVFDVLHSGLLLFENVAGRTATHILIGQDRRGRVLYIAILETEEHGVWKPNLGLGEPRSAEVIR